MKEENSQDNLDWTRGTERMAGSRQQESPQAEWSAGAQDCKTPKGDGEKTFRSCRSGGRERGPGWSHNCGCQGWQESM